jgi:Site-specific recombinases, DNA invertase Pin homologs
MKLLKLCKYSLQVLFNRKVAINILDVGLVDETPTGKLIFTVFSAFAKFEREMILTRTQEGKNMHENIIPIIEKDVNAYIVMHNRIRLQMENL